MGSPKDVALAFNQAINQRDLGALVALMTADHSFIDSEGSREQGRDVMQAGWRSFFDAYPDYHNVFEYVEARDDLVLMRGYSVCSNEPALDGTAIWTATIDGGKVSEWRVYEDTADNRRRLGLAIEE